MEEVVSIVVPIYNVENYLDRCLTSIVNQTYRNLEIILVDDGSTDSCPELCEKWASQDARIKVIHKKNAGLGMARNTGIDHATGSYICFFDSDDYVDDRVIEETYIVAKNEKADVVVFGMTSVDRQGNLVKQRIPESDRNCFCGEEVQTYFLPGLVYWKSDTAKVRNLSLSAWSCLFSTELIKRSNWRFVSERNIISEDVYSLLVLYKYVDKVAVLSESLYYYCENDTSLTRSYRADRFEQIKHFYHKCVELCREYEYPAEVERSCTSPFLGNTIGALKQEIAFHSTKREAMKGIRRIIDDELLQSALQVKKVDRVKPKIKMLFWAMRHKCYHLCYLLLLVNYTVAKK